MYVETADDLGRKFEGTYAKYKDQLVHIGEFITEEKEMFIVYTDQQGDIHTEIYEDRIQPIVLDTHFFNKTHKGWIPGTLYYRLAKKQYKRSISSENSHMECPLIQLYDLTGKSCKRWSSRWDFTDITAMLNPVYPNYFLALQQLNDNQCVALSPHFAVCLSTISANRYLFVSAFGFIGECDENVITIHHETAIQEVLDFVHRHALPLQVELNA